MLEKEKGVGLLKEVLNIIHRVNKKLIRICAKIRNLAIKGSFRSMKGLIKFPHQIEGARFISVGLGTVVGNGVILTAWEQYGGQKFNPAIEIGTNVRIGEYNQISACKLVKIGNNVLTGRRVYISDNNHGTFLRDQLDIPPIERPLVIKGPVIIDDNVWIGEHACILSGVHVGKGSVVAANAVVTHDVPPYSLVAGVPAQIIKKFPN
ncbi:DapH/DapD/GlmU-related protein [Fibrobacter sp. UWS1]|uniref:acyltransferase n=1 Tax=Fibrobacter sp. UWS1 TaxID=1896220 RepID=UPI0018E9FBE0|nr:acyltransferase [Fibrobacter sp. UWS1]